MKCEQSKKAILLDQSGELSPRKRRQLDAHLRACESCRSFKVSSVCLTRAASEHPGSAEVSPHTIHAIREAGRKAVGPHHRRRNSGESVGVLWRPVLVYATAAAIVLAAWVVVRHRPESAQTAAARTDQIAWENGIDREIEELGELLVMTSSDFQEYENGEDSLTTEDLATELLMWEGSS